MINPRSISDRLLDTEDVSRALDQIEAAILTITHDDLVTEITIARWRIDMVRGLAVQTIRDRMAQDPALLANGVRNIGVINRRLAALRLSYSERLPNSMHNGEQRIK